jgi:DNA invertase Pin-like site-specific DNA recombinase
VGRTIAYCRVSSRDQNPQLQLDALHAHGYDQLFGKAEPDAGPGASATATGSVSDRERAEVDVEL